MKPNQPDRDQLPEYVCTRRVQAGKIFQIEPPAAEGSRIWHLYLEGAAPGSFVLQPVAREYVAQHAPVAGGWFVREQDGKTAYFGPGQFEAEFARAPAFVPVTLGQVADDAYMREPQGIAGKVAA
jgi:hypothetical protein